jgi:vacuole membrane protein 1
VTLTPPPFRAQDPSSVTFWGMFWKIYLPCLLWGAGTAIGEIPPYSVTYAARLAGEVRDPKN